VAGGSPGELVVRGGTVVDGTGAAPFRGDVAIRDGRIVAIGEVPSDGRACLDASGCWVTPGFIDPHTHLDAQLCWDPTASPTNLHGVTTVALGLCGFGVAPCPDRGSDYLLRSLEVVEEIPFASTRLGVPFRWSSWTGYWSFVSKQPLAVNVSGFVPHSALRYFVMGDRARGETATDAERRAMVAELESAVAAGALGLATSRGPNHVDGFGDPVPSRFADHAELEALVGACSGRLWQINVETKFSHDAAALIRELDTYIGWSRAAGARLTWSPFHAEPGDGVWQQVLAHNDAINASGQVVAPQVAPLPLTLLLRFDEPSLVQKLLGLGDILADFFPLPVEERPRFLSDPSVRQALRDARPHPKLPFRPRLEDCSFLATPSRPDWDGVLLGEIAAARGVHAADLLCEQAIADGLATLIDVPLANSCLEGRVRFIEDAHTLLALGDSGAHVMSTTQYRYPTYLLAELVGRRGLLDVEVAVNRITQRPARLLGLRDRGELRPGAIADVCVVDPASLALAPVTIRHDLPGGSPRLFQAGRGYRAVLVAGVVTIDDDEPTGAAPGAALAAGERSQTSGM
jgi:N-acyl-D-aspartate/D-glutamate deacylase